MFSTPPTPFFFPYLSYIAADTFRTQFRQGGWNRVAGFATGGFVARVAHVAITTAMMKTATSKAYEMYYGIGQVGWSGSCVRGGFFFFFFFGFEKVLTNA